jgi:aminopeptidase N
VLSLLRDFSAPVRLDVDYSDADLAFLVQHETNGFNQWQAAQLLLERILLDQHPVDHWLAAMQAVLPGLADRDPLLASRLIEVPSENALASRIDRDYDPDVLGEHRDALLNKLAEVLRDFWTQAYAALPIVAYVDSAEAMGQRAWRNAVLAMACRAGLPEALDWASQQYDHAVCMTERLGALRMLVWHDAPDTQAKLDDFARRFADEALAMDLWFAVQASNPATTAAQARQLTEDPRFDWNTPNRIRSVSGQFASLPRRVWTPEGMQFYADLTARLDGQNAVLASRILQVLSRWFSLKEPLRSQAQAILAGLQGRVSSSSVTETLGNLLKAGQPD